MCRSALLLIALLTPALAGPTKPPVKQKKQETPKQTIRPPGTVEGKGGVLITIPPYPKDEKKKQK